MYTVVLMAALAAGEQTPDFFFFGCHGWHGSCGCHGWHGCHGSDGGYDCGGYYGCAGAGYGACYGYGYGGWGGWGAPYGCYGPPGWACYGGCAGTFSPAYTGAQHFGGPIPGAAPGATIPAPREEGKEEKETPKNKGKKEIEDGMSAARARLEVQLPQGARLFVDDTPVPLRDGKRTFRTPELEPGQVYYYEVRAEVMREGKPVSETRHVVIKPGQTAREDFRDLGTRPATSTARSR
jgi:uncharacterized protein (TIGR03000 family)